MIVLYIFLAILAFGMMIFFHELGHFAFAKIFKVAITEFSIGMGPKIFSKKGRDGVAYSLRLFPIGGFVAMEGEDEESEVPNAFNKKPAYQRFIIVIAGATMNILIAIIIVFFLTLTTQKFGTTIVAQIDETWGAQNELAVGDEITKVGNISVKTAEDLSYQIMYNGNKPVDLTVIRDGKEILLENVEFPTVVQEGDITFGRMTFSVKGEEPSFLLVLKHTLRNSVSTVRMIWDSLAGLLSGRFGFKQLSGPIGVTSAMVEVAEYGPREFFYLIAVISMNLGVFNLLPIPALDGGTLLFTGIEMVFKKRLPTKVEQYIKLVGLALLLTLVVIVSIKDVITLII